MSDLFEVRQAVSTDLPRLMGMDHSCSSDYVWQVDLRKEPGQVSVNLREVRLPRAVRVEYPRDPFALADEWKRKSAVLVAMDEIPVGYACLYEQASATTVWLTDLVVAPEKRRHGIATSLLKSAIAWAQQSRARMLTFEMQAKNQAAIRLAQKMGFEFCGYNDHYYVNQDVALFFGKQIR